MTKRGTNRGRAHGRQFEQEPEVLVEPATARPVEYGAYSYGFPAPSAHGFHPRELLEILFLSRWLIAGIVLLTLLAGLGYLWIAQPRYQSDAVLKIEETASGIGGVLGELSDLFKEETDVSAEIEMIKSRVVFGEVVDNLALEIVARPVYFPVVGAAFARRRFDSDRVAEPLIDSKEFQFIPEGLIKYVEWTDVNGYAWGGEQIQVESFDVPADQLGLVFSLVAVEGGYELVDPKGNVLLNGRPGELKEVRLAQDEAPISLLISEFRARPGTRFEIIRRRHLSVVKELQKTVFVREKGKESGFLQIQLEGANAEKITKIVNEISNVYLQQNLERKSEEVGKTLAFLEEQLVVTRKQLTAAEEALNSYRLEHGTVDLASEAQITLQRIVSIEADLSKLQNSRQELLQKFTTLHPQVASVDAQLATLNKQLAVLNGKVKALPDTQQDILRMSRDVEVATQLYTFLLNRIQEMEVVRSTPVGSVRVIDYAVTPNRAVWPKKTVLMTMFGLLGLLLGTGAAFLRKALRVVVEDPEVIEKQLGLPVYAVVQHSDKQGTLEKKGRRKHGSPAVLAVADAKDRAIEGLRSLRTVLQFVILGVKNNVFLVTGVSPGVGKSFISMNFGAVLASSGKRVLLIDADLRKGHLHQWFKVEAAQGLSDLIAGTCEIDQVICDTGVENLDFVPVGSQPPNPSELLLHERFGFALEEFSNQYDHIVIDSPPILAATDAGIIGRLAGATLLVVKAGAHRLQEIEQSVKQLRQAGVDLRGFVFNDMSPATSPYTYGKYNTHAYAYKG